jgi:hypothetical protein
MLTPDAGSADADFTDGSPVVINTFVSSRTVTKEDPHQPTAPYPLSWTHQLQQLDEKEELNIFMAYRKSLIPR